MSTNYDSIASSYDFLSRIVFGRALVRSQEALIPYIPAGSAVLIAGGGTGWILESIAVYHQQGLTIDYVESSERMLLHAQKKNTKGNTVRFIHQPIESYDPDHSYDIIITPFLFDNFEAEKAAIIHARLDAMLRSTGCWLYTDYVYDRGQSPLWQKLMLRIMYVSFRFISHVEASSLPDMRKFFSSGYDISYHASWYSGFIESIVYCKR